MTSPDIVATMHEEFALLLSRQDGVKDWFDSQSEDIKRICFAFYQDGYVTGGRHGAQLLADNLIEDIRGPKHD